jgi:p21-activated kinase 1
MSQPRKLKKSNPPISFHTRAGNTLRRAQSHNQRSRELDTTTTPSDTVDTTTHPSLHRAPSTSTFQSATQGSSRSLRTTPELIGAPFEFDPAVITKSINDTIASDKKARAHAQAQAQAHANANAHAHVHVQPPPLSHRNEKPKKLRESRSFGALARKMDTITPPRSDGGTTSPRQRYSDEADLSSKTSKRKSDGGKKKGTFSSLFSGFSSPRRPTISTPTNPMHVTHVSIDNQTGEFTVCVP